MDKEWHAIVDAQGRKGTVRLSDADTSAVEVRLASGEQWLLPKTAVTMLPDGMYRTHQLELANAERVVIPVVAEELNVSKERVARERVQVKTKVSSHDEPVDMMLEKEELRIEHVQIGRVVEQISAPRQEGDTLIVPVYEEVLFVEKRIVLREEVRLTRLRRDERVQERVTLRREDVVVEREKLDGLPDHRPGH